MKLTSSQGTAVIRYMAKRDKALFECINILRREGLSNNQVAKELSIHPSKAYRLYRWGLRKLSREKAASIIKRDENKCQSCGVGGELEVHHINSGRDHSEKNLITLCVGCHRRTDAKIRREKEKRRKAALKGWRLRRKRLKVSR